MTASVADILRQAADLIEPEGAWTQKSYAKGRTGREVQPEGNAAVCWCAIGALRRVDGEGVYGVLDALRGHIGAYAITVWNDDPYRTQAEVVTAFRAAADKAEEA
jgi:hypothetical protein